MSNFKLPPASKASVPDGKTLANKLKILVNREFPLTDKPRTNGATLRKVITTILDDGTINVANKADYSIVPSKKKGIPGHQQKPV